MPIVLIKSFTDKPWRNAETYKLIEDSLRQKWDVLSVQTSNAGQLFAVLNEVKRAQQGDLFVFNIAEYLDEENKEGFLPGLLEKWGFPHLGSSARAISLTLDKARTKDALVASGIPTPGYAIATQDQPEIDLPAENLRFPLIVKPLHEGGHIGIDEDSIVTDQEALNDAIKHVTETYDQPAIVEEYITGEGMREFSVGIIKGEQTLFTPIEIDFDAMGLEENILSYDVAQHDLEIIKSVDDISIRKDIIDLTGRTFDAVNASGYSRVDLRMNDQECYVLEINTMPGLGPNSFLPEAANDLHDLDYPDLIQRLAEDSIHSHHLFITSTDAT